MNMVLPFLLQGISNFQIQPKPIHGIIFFLGLSALVVLVVFLNKSAKVKNSTVFQSGTVNKPSLRNPDMRSLRKAGRIYGLERDERKFLSTMFRKEEIDPSSVFISVKNIDEGFSKLIQSLCKEEGTDGTIGKLFSIRNKIEYYTAANEAVEKAQDENLVVRRYKRSEADIPVVFYLVIEKEVHAGIKKIKKLSLDSIKCTGKILDISSGGCAMNTLSSYKTGSRIKIEFKIGKTNLSALAQILCINKARYGTVLHARFIKVSVKSLNAINTFVYNYSDF